MRAIANGSPSPFLLHLPFGRKQQHYQLTEKEILLIKYSEQKISHDKLVKSNSLLRMNSNVSTLISSAFYHALTQHSDLHSKWTSLSISLGGLLPHSLLTASIQRVGRLDILLRVMEKEFSPNSQAEDMTRLDNQMFLSEIWIGLIYEIIRLINERKLLQNENLIVLGRQLRLLRIALEKHEIAADRNHFPDQIVLHKTPETGTNDVYVYEKNSPKKEHIMPTGVSKDGSTMWQVIDAENNESRWIERLHISNFVLSLLEETTQENTQGNQS